MRKLAICLIKKVNSLIYPCFLKGKKFSSKDVKRILVLMPNGLGDVLISTPALRALRKKFKSATIDVLCYPWSKKVLERNPNADNLIERYGRLQGFGLRKNKYDLAVNFDLFIDNLTSFFAGAKYRAGYNIDGNGLMLHKWPIHDEDRHVVLYALDVVSCINAKDSNSMMELTIPKKDDLWARKTLSRIRGKRIVAIAPGGGNKPGISSTEKIWDIQNFIELIKKNKQGSRFILLGDKNDMPKTSLIVSTLKKENISVTDFAGKCSISESAALIKHSDIFVGNDSFLMHVASALDTPLIALFGPTNIKRLAPLNKNAISIKKGEDINDINVQDVSIELNKLYNRS
jgi:heptosyltransferase-2